MFSCVENRIFIQLHPDGQTYFKFESRGDSLDIYNQDFLHPIQFPGWKKTEKVVGENEEKNYSILTEGIIRDTSILFFPEKGIPLGYEFTRSISKTWFSTEVTFSLKFLGRHVKNEYPKLYEAILSEKSDSLYWLPEALTVLMEKGLNDLSKVSLSHREIIWNQRLVNHLKNSFSRMTTLSDLERIQQNRKAFLTELLKPFNVDETLPGNLAEAMEKHEEILQSTIYLNDDSFIVKVIMPGQTVFTNATDINLDTLIWKFGLDSLLTDSYNLKAESVIYTTERSQKTLISIGILFLILMGILIKKQF